MDVKADLGDRQACWWSSVNGISKSRDRLEAKAVLCRMSVSGAASML